jgi:multiple sugar transport system ATP-binding protein
MLELESITKKFDDTVAVNKLNLKVKDQEFLVIFGPAGAGKSTTLRLIAGVIKPTRGQIRFNGRPFNEVPPEHRNMSMVFENYALYSHMNVYDNLAFPLHARKLSTTEIKKRITRMAGILQIEDLLDRRPGFLSGGQRQRVALGRAMIREADIYLLDEPISHLDAKLRHLMRGEIKAMCSERAAMVIYVTHDYKEAMALSDRILVMNKGGAMQVASPDEVYHQPANEFVGAFLGDPSMSFLDAALKQTDGKYSLESGSLALPVSAATASRIAQKSPGGNVRVGIRASELSLSGNQAADCTIPATVYVVETFGYRNIVTCEFKGSGLVQSVASPELKIKVGETAWLNLSESKIHIFAPEGEAISHPILFKNGHQGGDHGVH